MKKAIGDFKEYTGIISIPKLTPHFLFQFRYDVEKEIEKYIRNNDAFQEGKTDALPPSFTCGYHIIDDESRNNPLNANLEERSRDLLFHSGAIEKFREKLYKVLIGKNNFARSFITSEYLYRNYSKSDQFDYTAIVSGYLKSVEQLMLQIALFSDGRGYRIKKKGGGWIALTSNNLENADTTMGALAKFFNYYNDTVPLNDINYRETFINCLYCYKSECRNDSFHQHNIESWERVEYIRNNTLFLHTILLGCCRLGSTEEETSNNLGIVNDAISRIYYHMTTNEELEYGAEFENEDPVWIERPYEVDYEKFDEFGLLKRNCLILKGKYYRELELDNPTEIDVKIDDKHCPVKLWMEDERCNRTYFHI